jgi:lipopolysaccharide/colanic/teichoic acid biosynthesis glycosyltransferase
MLGHSATVEDRRDGAAVPVQAVPAIVAAQPREVPTSGASVATSPGSIPEPSVLDHLAGVEPATRRLGYAAKRALDLVGAATGLIVFAPLFAAVGLAILLDDGRPIFFRQPRAGRYGRSFTIVKFRSMHDGADALRAGLRVQNEVSGGASFKMTHDPRVTRLGRILRRTSIDELPQLWNVLRGDMSLVGPRPHPFDDLDGYAEWHYSRLAMKPGMTGLWQVSARRDPDFDRWVQQDLEYVRGWSLGLDVRLLLQTIPAVLRGSGR